MSHAMTIEEREAFLADLHVGVIGAVADGQALVVPIWYDYEPGGDVWVITGPDSRKGRALEDSGRYALCAQTEDAPYKYVTVEGPVTAVDDASDEVRRSMAHRYLGAEMGDAYVEATEAENAGGRVYRMTPETWFTVDYGKDFG